MPQFILDTSGEVEGCAPFEFPARTAWCDLTAFTQGYIEALFFTSGESPGVFMAATPGDDGQFHLLECGFADLATDALATITADCTMFYANYGRVIYEAGGGEKQAGRDFWYTRNGHGCGFWDGDWPEPQASILDKAARAFGECDAIIGDDGKVYVSA